MACNVGCFFFAFPLFFVIFILARHAVFGDESDSSQAHKHEVPASSHLSFESGQELIDMNNNSKYGYITYNGIFTSVFNNLFRHVYDCLSALLFDMMP